MRDSKESCAFPDSKLYTLADDHWDLWANGEPIFPNVSAALPDRPITDIKFVYNNGYGSITMDNFNIRTVPAVPEPRGTGLLAVAFLGAIIIAARCCPFRRRHSSHDSVSSA